MDKSLMSYMFDFMCSDGHTRTLAYDADSEGRPPAPADVPKQLECNHDGCFRIMRRS